jgi:hypothetical protein
MMDGFDSEHALPALRGIWQHYADSTRPGEQRIAEVVRQMIEELEQDEAAEDPPAGAA